MIIHPFSKASSHITLFQQRGKRYLYFTSILLVIVMLFGGVTSEQPGKASAVQRDYRRVQEVVQDEVEQHHQEKEDDDDVDDTYFNHTIIGNDPSVYRQKYTTVRAIDSFQTLFLRGGSRNFTDLLRTKHEAMMAQRDEEEPTAVGYDEKYMRGLIFLGFTIFLLFLSWLLFITIFYVFEMDVDMIGKACCNVWCCCCSCCGYTSSGSSSSTTATIENSNNDDDDDDTTNEKKKKHSKNISLSSLLIHRCIFFISTLMIIIFSIILISKGLSKLKSSTRRILSLTHDFADLHYQAYDTMSYVTDYETTILSTRDAIQRYFLYHSCINTGSTNSNSNAPELMRKLGNDIIFGMENFRDDVDGEHLHDFEIAIATIGNFTDHAIEFANEIQFPKSVSVICLFMYWMTTPILIFAAILMWKNNSNNENYNRNKRSYNKNDKNDDEKRHDDLPLNIFFCCTSWLIFPLFVITILISIVGASTTAAVGSFNADFCHGDPSNTPEPTLTSLLHALHHSDNNNNNDNGENKVDEYHDGKILGQDILTFYMHQCETNTSTTPFDVLDEYKPGLVFTESELERLAGTLETDEAIWLANQCEMQLQPQAQRIRSMGQMTSDLQHKLYELSEVLRCSEWVPIYTSIVYDEICTNSVTALFWTYKSFLIISIAGTISLMYSYVCFPRKKVVDKYGRTESNAIVVYRPKQNVNGNGSRDDDDDDDHYQDEENNILVTDDFFFEEEDDVNGDEDFDMDYEFDIDEGLVHDDDNQNRHRNQRQKDATVSTSSSSSLSISFGSCDASGNTDDIFLDLESLEDDDDNNIYIDNDEEEEDDDDDDDEDFPTDEDVCIGDVRHEGTAEFLLIVDRAVEHFQRKKKQKSSSSRTSSRSSAFCPAVYRYIKKRLPEEARFLVWKDDEEGKGKGNWEELSKKERIHACREAYESRLKQQRRDIVADDDGDGDGDDDDDNDQTEEVVERTTTSGEDNRPANDDCDSHDDGNDNRQDARSSRLVSTDTSDGKTRTLEKECSTEIDPNQQAKKTEEKKKEKTDGGESSQKKNEAVSEQVVDTDQEYKNENRKIHRDGSERRNDDDEHDDHGDDRAKSSNDENVAVDDKQEQAQISPTINKAENDEEQPNDDNDNDNDGIPKPVNKDSNDESKNKKHKKKQNKNEKLKKKKRVKTTSTAAAAAAAAGGNGNTAGQPIKKKKKKKVQSTKTTNNNKRKKKSTKAGSGQKSVHSSDNTRATISTSATDDDTRVSNNNNKSQKKTATPQQENSSSKSTSSTSTSLSPTDEDIIVDDEDHAGTKDMLEIIQKAIDVYDASPYNAEIYRFIIQRLMNRRPGGSTRSIADSKNEEKRMVRFYIQRQRRQEQQQSTGSQEDEEYTSSSNNEENGSTTTTTENHWHEITKIERISYIGDCYEVQRAEQQLTTALTQE